MPTFKKIGKIYYGITRIKKQRDKPDGSTEAYWSHHAEPLDENKNLAQIKFGEFVERWKAKRFNRPVNAGEMSWASFRDEYLRYSRNSKGKRTQITDAATIKQFEQTVNISTLSEFTASTIEKYRETRKKTPFGRKETPRYRKDSTINRDLDVLKAMGVFAKARGYLTENPLESVKKKPQPKTLPRFYTDSEMESLRAACIDTFDRTVIDLAYYTGMRQGEIVNLQWRHVDFNGGVIRISQELGWTSKDYEERDIPIVPKLDRILRDWKKESGGNYVIMTHGRQVREDYIGWRFEMIRKWAGVTGTFHQLRHTFGHRLGRMNMNQKKIAELMGHASTRTSDRYTHSDTTSKRNDMTKSL